MIAYQLKVVLHGFSPMIWRRLVVPDDNIIADLHDILLSGVGRQPPTQHAESVAASAPVEHLLHAPADCHKYPLIGIW
jgi:hypothetical protein